MPPDDPFAPRGVPVPRVEPPQNRPPQPRPPQAQPQPAAPPAPAARRPQGDVLAAIALGGGLGSLARYGLARALPTAPGDFPWATFTVNVAGSFALGLLMVYVLEVWPPSRLVRPFLGVGVIGGFTTFSTYGVETRGLLAAHAWTLAAAYALGSLAAGLTAVWAGITTGRRTGRTRAATRTAAPADARRAPR
jgi:CrcB protein